MLNQKLYIGLCNIRSVQEPQIYEHVQHDVTMRNPAVSSIQQVTLRKLAFQNYTERSNPASCDQLIEIVGI